MLTLLPPPSPLVDLWGKPDTYFRMSQWNKRMHHWGSLQIFLSLGCLWLQFCLTSSLQASFCAHVCLSLGVFWATEWIAGVAEAVIWNKLLYAVNCSIWGTWLQEILGHLWNICLPWWQGDRLLCHVPVLHFQDETGLCDCVGLVGFILGGCGGGLAA